MDRRIAKTGSYPVIAGLLHRSRVWRLILSMRQEKIFLLNLVGEVMRGPQTKTLHLHHGALVNIHVLQL